MEEILDFSASDVEACRICLATDIRLRSLQESHLGTCMESIGGFTKPFDGLPKYVCYECAPILIKCYKLIEKSKIAESTLQEIFIKNGMINKTLIEEQKKSDPKLQSPLDSYLLMNYFYVKYDDDNNTSDFIKIESDPNEANSIKLKNEIKGESGDEVSDSEILKMIKILSQEDGTMQNFSQENETNQNFSQEDETMQNLSQEDETIKNFSQEDETIQNLGQEVETNNNLSKDEETNSDSDVEAIEVDVPLVEILSDDEKSGDDFISLKSYSAKMDNPVNGLLTLNDVPIYNRKKMRPFGVGKRIKKNQKKSRIQDPPPSNQDEDKFVRRYFNIKIINKPGREPSKKYHCKSCPQTYNYANEARDHIIIGCQISSSNNGNPSWNAPSNSITGQLWEVWPGGNH
ncbi:hypothetical protein PYW08_004867 [Mythimna loreyi]|uniref:Uncharacterized protein n=1 Tax=Mythimna loreyi TaxID=667449 RepID=A0ACC2QDV6_9NEOP|nr:hypothetical protein PYW08_004867 [Mythimna loreyi]